jgi:hypothetical protein
MKIQISIRDLEELSAYLDGQLSQAVQTRLESRLKADPKLSAALDELRQVRLVLRRIPQRRAPRRFTLSREMTGIKPPLPRLVPAFSWASAVAVLLFIVTLGTNMIGRLSFGAAAPMMASEPMGLGGGGVAPEGQAVSETAVDSTNDYLTATPESYVMAAPEVPPSPEERTFQPPDEQPMKSRQPLNPWLVIWPGLAVVFTGSALLLRWFSIRTFRRKSGKK